MKNTKIIIVDWHELLMAAQLYFLSTGKATDRTRERNRRGGKQEKTP